MHIIGTGNSNAFTGVFDGDDHTISNFVCTYSYRDYAGLFRYAAGATIKNLGLVGPYLDVALGSYHGALVGRLDTGIVTNWYVETGSIFASRDVGVLDWRLFPSGAVNAHVRTRKRRLIALLRVVHRAGKMQPVRPYDYAVRMCKNPVGRFAGLRQDNRDEMVAEIIRRLSFLGK
ncbi:MAG: hypothetical protein ISS70_19465 [Phycisphaerae bacterium]|nr:hypothetical protein [Phycisphaerae bacterium]